MRKKKGNRDNVKMGNRDRISFLPDEIQTKIVSYLPTEEAFKTTLLSTRWRKVCSSLSIFNFDLHRFSEQVKIPGVHYIRAFTSFVRRTLVLHDESDINSFNLEFGMMNGVAALLPHCDQWISFAISHNVKQFRLFPHGTPLGYQIIIPPSLFTCSSLTTMLLANINLRLPEYVTFPNLKKLTLLWVSLLHANDAKRLCLSSPLLEFLSLSSCTWQKSSTTLILPAPNLKFFTIEDHFQEIELSSTNLYQVWYEGIPINFSTNIINSSLVEAKLIITKPSGHSNELSVDWASKILLRLCNVTKLGLNGNYIEYLARERDLIARLPTLCCTLKDLSLTLNATLKELKIIILLLKSYPCLQTLGIHFKPCHLPEDYEETRELDTQTVLNKLTCVKFYSFEGCKIEFDLVSYLLGNATALEKMKIKLARWSYSQNKGINSTRITENIQMFTRVSPNVVISVSDRK